MKKAKKSQPRPAEWTPDGKLAALHPADAEYLATEGAA